MSNKQKIPPRIVPDRDSKYMGLAWMMAGFSKDPSTQIGCVIISSNNEPQGWGYNGPPADISDYSFSWERPEKYSFIKHAEDNAIDHSHGTLEDSTLYVTGLPCKACMLDIISKKIKKVVYMDKDYDPQSMQAVKEDVQKVFDLANMAGVKLTRFSGDIGWVEDWVLHLKEISVIGGAAKA